MFILSRSDRSDFRCGHTLQSVWLCTGRAVGFGLSHWEILISPTGETRYVMIGFLKQFRQTHLREFVRLVRNRKVEQTEDGLLLLGAGVVFRGVQSVLHEGVWRDHKNLLTTEGLNHMLDVTLHGSSQTGTWYLAPFSGNVTPLATHTAATFAATFTELTNTHYSEATRVAFVEGAASAAATDNYASPATITTATSNVTVYGAGLLSVATKSSTSGVLLAAAKYASAYSLPTSGGTLGLKYQVSATSA